MSNHNLSPTVFGIETEYTSMVVLSNDQSYEMVGKCHDKSPNLRNDSADLSKTTANNIDKDALNFAVESIGVQRKNEFLTNGARFYIDLSGFEYATAECTTAGEAVLRSLDGDDFVYNVLGKLLKSGYIQSFQLNRRTNDHMRYSRGTHLNTSIIHPSLLAEPEAEESHIALNVAKGSMFGSGGIMLEHDGSTKYYHSPRLAVSSVVSRTGSVDSKPIIREDTKLDVGCHRIETVSGDALNFAWPLRASLVMTNAINKLIEAKRHKEIPNLVLPLKAAKDVGLKGPEAKLHVYKNSNDESVKKYRSFELLSQIAEICLIADEEASIYNDSETRQVLGEVIDMADIMKRDLYSAASQVESLARWLAIQRRMESAKVSIDSEKVCRFDYYWDKIGGGLAEQLRENRGLGWLGFKNKNSPSSRKHRLLNPPQDTRAKLRSEAIHRGVYKNIGWYKVSLDESNSTEFHPLQIEYDFDGLEQNSRNHPNEPNKYLHN